MNQKYVMNNNFELPKAQYILYSGIRFYNDKKCICITCNFINFSFK